MAVSSFSIVFQASNYNDFGHSWAVAGLCPADECDIPPPEQCTDAEKAAALQICNKIINKFQVCQPLPNLTFP